MTFRIKIQCDNAAFDDDYRTELARILKDIATKLEGGRDGGYVQDSNGNTVGNYALKGRERSH